MTPSLNTVWPALVPELLVRDTAQSRRFYCDLLGFCVRFARDEDRFVYLERGQAHLMLDTFDAVDQDAWVVAPMNYPFGRGMNLQLEVEDLDTILERLELSGYHLFRPLMDSAYSEGDITHRQRECLVQDPDGYLIRLAEISDPDPDPLP
ncbi:MAG: bleomycin resistance protein [Asticcacaulis sp.]